MLGMGIGFVIGLFALGAVREILGAGTLFGYRCSAPSFQPWVVMVLPPGGFIVLGGWLLLFSALKRRQEARPAAAGGGHGA
jgi:electron transport complex protein RnfE